MPLAKLQTYLAAIVDSSDDAIIGVRLDGVIGTWNLAAERLFGYTAPEAVGRHLALIEPPELLGEIAGILGSVARGNTVRHLRTVRIRKNGGRIAVSVTVSPIRDAVLQRENLAHDVKVVHDRAEALEFIFSASAYAGRGPAPPPKMLLLDLKLPTLDGMEVLRRAKADPRTRGIPVVVFSSSSEERDRHQAAELGAHSYVVKPVDFRQFAEAVRAALAITITRANGACRREP
ncbi:MAG: PAS domain S-box protein [Bryobacteraceae bacterium]|jgi:PAS domain S-box-containing protein